MHGTEIASQIYWIGKIDDRKVPFHRLILEKGTSYNSYLLKTQKPTIIDTVDIDFGREYIDNLSKLINPEEIAYIVINHVEPDHAGALPALAARAKNAKIVARDIAVELLKDMFKLHNREFMVMRDGDKLDIGGKTLQFFETPYLHTEETMVTYDMDDKILFSCDQFSTHVAPHELFNDLAEEGFDEDFTGYYKLIIAPHRPYVRDMLEKIKNLSIRIIAPSHGYIIRQNVEKYISLYDEMSDIDKMPKNKKVAIAYSTMTGNTAKIVQRLSEGLEQLGIASIPVNLKSTSLDEAKEKILECDALLAGSSTRYADMVGGIEELLFKLEGENLKGKPAAAFGSYGWSGEAVIHIEEHLQKLGFEVINRNYLIKHTGVDEGYFPLRVKYSSEEGLKHAEEAGKIFGEQVLMH